MNKISVALSRMEYLAVRDCIPKCNTVLHYYPKVDQLMLKHALQPVWVRMSAKTYNLPKQPRLILSPVEALAFHKLMTGIIDMLDPFEMSVIHGIVEIIDKEMHNG